MINAFRSPVARHQHILRRVEEEGTVRVSALPEVLGVTAMTVWRDLKVLEEQGLLWRGRGVVGSIKERPGEDSFESKQRHGQEAKQRIAECAVRLFVREGDVLALEGGTTVAALADALPDQRISITTNSLPIAMRLRERHPALPVRVIGGWLSSVSGNATGPETLRELARSRYSVCFLSATGWDPARGPMDPNPMEIEVKRVMASCAQRVVLLLDAGKFLLRSNSVMIHPRRLDALVTDSQPPPEIMAQLQEHGVRMVLA
jgi:DeoR family transcriptional regulator, fructose operon transcriptional repressor